MQPSTPRRLQKVWPPSSNDTPSTTEANPNERQGTAGEGDRKPETMQKRHHSRSLIDTSKPINICTPTQTNPVIAMQTNQIKGRRRPPPLPANMQQKKPTYSPPIEKRANEEPGGQTQQPINRGGRSETVSVTNVSKRAPTPPNRLNRGLNLHSESSISYKQAKENEEIETNKLNTGETAPNVNNQQNNGENQVQIEPQRNKAMVLALKREAVGKENEQVDKREKKEEKIIKFTYKELEEKGEEEKEKIINKRNFIFQEILSTERSYVNSIENIVKHYIEPLKQQINETDDPVVTNEEMLKLFSNIEVILKVNLELLQQLEERNKLWKEQGNDRCGDIFISTSPYFKLYSEYEKYSETSIALMNNKLLLNERFLDFEYSKLSLCNGLSLSALLIMPIQRIPRYRLLLEDLIRNTWTDHSDYTSLENALTAIKSVAQSLNDDIRAHEKNSKVQEIGEMIKNAPMNLVAPHRYFVHEEDSMRISYKKKKIKEYQIYLFNDILLITKSKKFRFLIEFNSCWIRLLPDVHVDLQNVFEIWSPVGCFRFIFPNLKKKNQILNLIQNLIQQLIDVRPVIEDQRIALFERMAPKIISIPPDYVGSSIFIENLEALEANHCLSVIQFSLRQSIPSEYFVSSSSNPSMHLIGSANGAGGSLISSSSSSFVNNPSSAPCSPFLSDSFEINGEQSMELVHRERNDTLSNQNLLKPSTSYDHSLSSLSAPITIQGATKSNAQGSGSYIGGTSNTPTSSLLSKSNNEISVVSFKIGVIKEGEMTKQGGNIKNWKKRWFVLEKGHLYYYKDKIAVKPKGDIVLQSVHVVKVPIEKSGKPNSFLIATRGTLKREGRDYLIYCDTPEECDEWVSVLKNQIATSSQWIKFGWLLKRENKWKKWRSRWWTLDAHNLYYYKNDEVFFSFFFNLKNCLN